MFLWRSNWDCEGCPREAKFLRPKQIFIHAMLLFYSVAAPRLNVRTTTAVPLVNVVLRNLGSSSLAILWLVTINKSVIFMGVSGWKDKHFRLPHDIESSLFGFSARVNVLLIKNQCCYNVSHNSFTMLVIVL